MTNSGLWGWTEYIQAFNMSMSQSSKKHIKSQACVRVINTNATLTYHSTLIKHIALDACCLPNPISKWHRQNFLTSTRSWSGVIKLEIIQFSVLLHLCHCGFFTLAISVTLGMSARFLGNLDLPCHLCRSLFWSPLLPPRPYHCS